MNSVPPGLPPDVHAALDSRDKVEAIRLLRERTGLGLKEAMDVVQGSRPAPTLTSRQARAGSEISAEVVALIGQGKKIEAIKLLREQTGLALKEAKDIVDTSSNSKSTSGQQTLAPGEVAGGRFKGAWLVLAAVLAALVAWKVLGAGE